MLRYQLGCLRFTDSPAARAAQDQPRRTAARDGRAGRARSALGFVAGGAAFVVVRLVGLISNLASHRGLTKLTVRPEAGAMSKDGVERSLIPRR